MNELVTLRKALLDYGLSFPDTYQDIKRMIEESYDLVLGNTRKGR